MSTRESGGAPDQNTAAEVEPATSTEANSPIGNVGVPTVSATTVAALSTEELDRLVPALDAHVRAATRALPSDPVLDDLRSFAGACRIERRRRHGHGRLADAHRLRGNAS